MRLVTFEGKRKFPVGTEFIFESNFEGKFHFEGKNLSSLRTSRLIFMPHKDHDNDPRNQE